MLKNCLLFLFAIIFFLLVFATSCIHKENSSDSGEFSKIKTEEISVNVKDQKPIPMSRVFDSLEYIPLETNKESLFGSISKIEVTDEYFIILDQTSNSILIFKKNGKFFSKISNQGKSIKDSYRKIQTFTVNRKDKQIIISDPYLDKMVFYDYKGNKLKDLANPFYYRTFYSNGDNMIYYRSYYNLADESNIKNATQKYSNLFFTNGLSRIYKTMLRYDPKIVDDRDLFSSAQNFFSSGDKKCILSFPYNYQMFQLDSSGVKSIIKVNLPVENTLPSSFMTSKSFTNQRMRFISDARNNKIIWELTDVYTVGEEILSFSLKCTKYSPYFFIYNRKTQKYIEFNNIYSDKLSAFLPVLSNGINCSDGKFLYGSINSESIINAAMNPFIRNELNKNQCLFDFYKTASNLSNPVILKFKINYQ